MAPVPEAGPSLPVYKELVPALAADFRFNVTAWFTHVTSLGSGGLAARALSGGECAIAHGPAAAVAR
jgi:DNA gyrase inhibitor GyrI